MLTFEVVKQQHGWAVRLGDQMTTPYWSREIAVREAHCLADALRTHGECVQVVIEPIAPPLQDHLIAGRRGGGPIDAARPGP